VRIPAATTAHLANGTGNLTLAALVYDDGVAATVKAALGNKGATSFDTVGSVAASSGAGRQLVTISGLHCSRPEEINSLRIQLRYGSAKAASLAIYGTALAHKA